MSTQQLTLQQTIIEVVNDYMDGNVNVRHSYTGRGMYKNTCFGIVGSEQDCMSTIKETVRYMIDNTDSDIHSNLDMLFNFRTDSMGRQSILYWPQLDSIDSTNDEDDE